MTTPYYIDFFIAKDRFGVIEAAYYRLIRRRDDAILYSNQELDNVFLHCFHAGISNKDIVII